MSYALHLLVALAATLACVAHAARPTPADLPAPTPATAAAPAAAARPPGVVPAAKATSGAATQARLARWLEQAVELPGGQRLRVEVEVGEIGRGVRLAPCQRTEPFLPGQARLWGRATIGLRCVEGARWTTFVPVRILAWGPALVARSTLPVGRILQTADFTVQEVDWAASHAMPVASTERLNGQELSRPLAAGLPLLADQIRHAPAVRAGQPVTAVLVGTGFSIGTEAVALNNAADGQRIRVRTVSGKVLDGTVSGKSVRIFR